LVLDWPASVDGVRVGFLSVSVAVF